MTDTPALIVSEEVMPYSGAVTCREEYRMPMKIWAAGAIRESAHREHPTRAEQPLGPQAAGDFRKRVDRVHSRRASRGGDQ